DSIITAEDFLKNHLYTKQEIDDWLANNAFPFAKYNSEFGWLLNSDFIQDGVDNTVSVYNYVGEDGERIMTNYADKPCRINTYGDSFTQCHQVSDNETWQEVIAAHIQEPVRNYGIGGWSSYQAYLRILKEEIRNPAKYIIFNIYQDDHRRNLDSWRNIRVNKHPKFIEPPLPYLEVDLKNKEVVEHPNPCNTPESLYQLCDLEKTKSLFEDDFVLQIMLAHLNSKLENPYRSYSHIMSLTKTHGIETNIESNENLSQVAEDLHIEASLFASGWVIDRIEEFAEKNDKKVLYVLSYPASSIAKYIETGERWDNPFVDYLKKKEVVFVDMAEEHKTDYMKYKISIEDYLDQYFIGHYNPLGNHFHGFAIKNKLVGLLDPKPRPYQTSVK
ncbi:unnamed protein product, partial [Chrysoparadoxa australica]